MPIQTIKWVNGSVRLIDQTKLPNRLTYLTCRDVKSLWHAIKRLSVRGAPAIGAAAAFGVLLGIKSFRGSTRAAFDKHIKKVSDYIATSRPTAVNLFNALAQMEAVLKNNPKADLKKIKALLHKEAMTIFKEDQRVCRKMGEYGAKLIKKGVNALTICNAGALATVDYGTALGVFYAAKKARKKFHVYACETRPLLQGARLTAWELMQSKIDTTLICDSMAATLMKQGKVDIIFTGADRVASNGDAANKIGTYNLAVLAKHHGVPFYIVAPYSTFDLTIKNGKQIPIEERGRDEVINFRSVQTAPKKVKVYNPAFDVTENSLITGIITEYGIIKNPTRKKVKKVLGK